MIVMLILLDHLKIVLQLPHLFGQSKKVVIYLIFKTGTNSPEIKVF
jgi:hypothetical protein